MMNIVGNQIIHEAADHYGWKEGSTEKLLLHGAVSGSVNEFALAYMEKTKGRDWRDTHPDTVQAISIALGAVTGSLTDRATEGTYTAQMGTGWNNLMGNECIEKLAEKAGEFLTSEEKETVIEFISKGMTKETNSYLAQKTLSDYLGVVKEYARVFEGVRFWGESKYCIWNCYSNSMVL